jgi:predicted ATPase
MPEQLETITVKGFRSIASVEELRLAPINVLIGPNGSGKSNFIGVFSFLHAIRSGKLQEYVGKAGGAEKILHFGSKFTKRLHIRISFRQGTNAYEIDLEPTADDALVPVSETVYFWDKVRYPEKPYDETLSRAGMEAGISSSMRGIAQFVRGHLSSWRLYHVHDTSANSPMRTTADLNDNQFLRPDGSNLASLLYFLRQRHEASYGLIRNTIQLVAPFFDDFVLEPSKLNPDKIRLEWRYKGSDAYFDVSSLSDGTLRFMVLATLFLQPSRPSVILVDEPELGLHPFAVEMLASLVRQVSTETQVILSTQSSLLLDQFKPEDVVIADLVDGATEFTRPNPEELAKWLEDYSLGQLWEKNVIGGRPE